MINGPVANCATGPSFYGSTFQSIPNNFQNCGTLITCTIGKYRTEQLKIRLSSVQNAAHSAFDQDLSLSVGINIKLIFINALEQNAAHFFQRMPCTDIEPHFLQLLPVSLTGIVGVLRIPVSLRAILVRIVQIGLNKAGAENADTDIGLLFL